MTTWDDNYSDKENKSFSISNSLVQKIKNFTSLKNCKNDITKKLLCTKVHFHGTVYYNNDGVQDIFIKYLYIYPNIGAPLPATTSYFIYLVDPIS